MKRTVTIALACLLLLSMTGCIERNTTNYEIAVLGMHAEPFGREAEILAGVKEYAESAGLTYAYYPVQEDSFDARESAIRHAMNNRAKLLFAADPSFSEVIYEKQFFYEKYDFSMLGILPRSMDGTNVAVTENIAVMLYDERAAGYLAGDALVKEGYLSLGFVDEGGHGYYSGFVEAAEAGGAVVRYTANASDASLWYDEGVEVVFATGDSVDAVAKIAAQKGGKVVGTEYDRSYLGDAVLSSLVKDWKASAYAVSFLWHVGYWRDESEHRLAESVRTVGAGTSYSAYPARDWFGFSDFSAFRTYSASMQAETLSLLSRDREEK